MHQWHITLAFGFALGYGARYLFETMRHAKKQASVYKGRWPVVVAALLTAEGCIIPPPPPRIIRVVTYRTYKVRRPKPTMAAIRHVIESDDEVARALERESEEAARRTDEKLKDREPKLDLEEMEELFPGVPDAAHDSYKAEGCLR